MYQVPLTEAAGPLTCPNCGKKALSFWQKATMLKVKKCKNCGIKVGVGKKIGAIIYLFSYSGSLAILLITKSWLLIALFCLVSFVVVTFIFTVFMKLRSYQDRGDMDV